MSINSPLSTCNEKNLRSIESVNNFSRRKIHIEDNEDLIRKNGILDQTKNILEKTTYNTDTRTKANRARDDYKNYSPIVVLPFRGDEQNNNKKYDVENSLNTFNAFSSKQSMQVGEEYYQNYKKYDNEIDYPKKYELQSSISSNENDNRNRINFLENEVKENHSIINELKREISFLTSDKDKFENLMLKEREKNIQLNNDIDSHRKIAIDYKDLDLKYLSLTNDYENLYQQYGKSESIRIEQNKLIKSLQTEIDLLRESNLAKNKEKIKSSRATMNKHTEDVNEVYKSMVNNEKKRKKTKPKKKISSSTSKSILKKEKSLSKEIKLVNSQMKPIQKTQSMKKFSKSKKKKNAF
jgi:hypothetical protein